MVARPRRNAKGRARRRERAKRINEVLGGQCLKASLLAAEGSKIGPTPQAVIEKIERLRRQRWTGKQIAVEPGELNHLDIKKLGRIGSVGQILAFSGLKCIELIQPQPTHSRGSTGDACCWRNARCATGVSI